MSSTTPRLKLFKNTNPANQCAYIGSLLFPVGHPAFPKGRVFPIECEVVEHDDGAGKKGKHFEGTIPGAGQELAKPEVKALLKGARFEGDPSAIPQDLLAQIEKYPFDDSAAFAKDAIPNSEIANAKACP